LLSGDLENAQQSFSRALELRQANTDAATEDERNCDTLLDVAFLSMANSDFLGALSTLQQAENVRPGDPMVINNIAVCYLYVGKLKEGLSYLESRLTANPSLMLQDTVVLNLCTLYELESSYAGQKKRSLLDLVSQFKGDGFNAACLKLQM
jgi:Flp pilus assembly protein TadD